MIEDISKSIEGQREGREGAEGVEVLKQTDVIMVRHGDRTGPGGVPGASLSPLGETVNASYANMIARRPEYAEGFTSVESIGSTIKSRDEEAAGKLGRSAVTAEQFAKVIGKKDVHTTEIDILNYNTTTNEAPYDHTKEYNEAFAAERTRLAEKFPHYTDDQLNDLAADVAQSTVAKHLNDLVSKGDEKAVKYTREWAGAYAYLLMHYIERDQSLPAGAKSLATVGLHGPTFEWLLKYALVREDKGKTVKGFEALGEISSDYGREEGGFQHTSESFTLSIQTLRGVGARCLVRFNDPSKWGIGTDLRLDMDEVRVLADEYKALHPELVEATKDESKTGKYGAIETTLKKY